MKKFDVFNVPELCPAGDFELGIAKGSNCFAYWRNDGPGRWSNSSSSWKNSNGWSNSSSSWRNDGHGWWSNSTANWRNSGGWSDSSYNWRNNGGWSNSGGK